MTQQVLNEIYMYGDVHIVFGTQIWGIWYLLGIVILPRFRFVVFHEKDKSGKHNIIYMFTVFVSHLGSNMDILHNY